MSEYGFFPPDGLSPEFMDAMKRAREVHAGKPPIDMRAILEDAKLVGKCPPTVREVEMFDLLTSAASALAGDSEEPRPAPPPVSKRTLGEFLVWASAMRRMLPNIINREIADVMELFARECRDSDGRYM